MGKVLINESSLVDIGDAIRGKLGVQALYKPSQMAGAIEQISGDDIKVTEYDYADFPGTTKIILPYELEAGMSFEVEFNARAGNNQAICGVYGTEYSGNATWNRIIISDTYIYVGQGDISRQTYLNVGAQIVGYKHNVKINQSGRIIVDNVDIGEYIYNNPNDYKLPLCLGFNYITTPGIFFNGKLYKYKVNLNGDTIIDLKPVKASGKYSFSGLLNRINNAIYTGDIAIGNDE